jgi:hypothetical protein
VLAELGYAEHQIDQLRAQGTVGAAPERPLAVA